MGMTGSRGMHAVNLTVEVAAVRCTFVKTLKLMKLDIKLGHG